jgi:ribosome-associated toxin RatA of RatAB toxin-antitoxin module
MPIVEVKELIRAPIEDVWALICDVQAYPRLMEPVLSLTVLEEGDGWLTTAWEVELKGSILKWTEREERDHARHYIAYRQIEGDLEEFEGFWRLRETEDGVTEAVLAVRFEIGIPMLREMLDPVAERAIRENARKMLASLAPSLAGA